MLDEQTIHKYLSELMRSKPYHRYGKNKAAIDFSGVYILFNKDYEVVYVGQSRSIYMRVYRGHKKSNKTWEYAKAVHITDYAEMVEFEAWCISKYNPKYNYRKGRPLDVCKHCDNSGYFLKDGQPTRCTHCNWMGQKDEV